MPWSGSSAASAQAPAGSSITVAAGPGGGDAALYVAQQQGLFRQAGPTVHVRSYHTPAAEGTALDNGTADVARCHHAPLFYPPEKPPALSPPGTAHTPHG